MVDRMDCITAEAAIVICVEEGNDFGAKKAATVTGGNGSGS